MLRIFSAVAMPGMRTRNRIAGHHVRKFSVTNNEWIVFPREKEGNIYSVNHSLTEDGVTPVGDAFRNARFPILVNRLEGKLSNNSVEIAKPVYFGNCKVKEAGDDISHELFSDIFAAQSEHLSSGVTLFVEDASLGVHTSARLGVRVTTDNAAVALIARKLLVATPPREVDHKSKFKGWNLDPRWDVPVSVWNGDKCDVTLSQTVALPAQRSIIALVGGPGEDASVQFVEKNKELVGANVVAGTGAPVRSVITALGHAASVLINEEHSAAVVLPSLVLSKGKETVVVVNADDSVADWATKGSALYGAYNNVLTVEGVSALWNGVIGGANETKYADETPTLKVGGHAAHSISPDNLTHPASHFIFFEKNASSAQITPEDAVQRIVALSHGSKEELAKILVKNARLTVVGNVEELNALLKF